MTPTIPRRSLLGSLLAAPFVIRTPGLLMPVRAVRLADKRLDFYRAVLEYQVEPGLLPCGLRTDHWLSR